MQTGRLKIFKSCTNLLKELSLYHRDDKGKIVKKNDHLIDAMRYLVMSGLSIAGCQLEVVPRKNNTVNFAAWT